MKQNILLYKKTVPKFESEPQNSLSEYGYSINLFKPSLFKMGIDNSELLKRFLWFLITMGNYRILYFLEGSKIVHYSYIIPKNFRFPFMSKNELEIGPCFTDPNHRGRGIYTSALQLIPYLFRETTNTFWIYTVQSNLTSQRAIEKTGYEFFGLYKNSGILKILEPIDK